jgi:hypothetical protein
MKRRDLTGERFGRLVVKGDASRRQNRSWWWCRCDCGNYTKVSNSGLLRGKKKSCGCLRSPHYSLARGGSLIRRKKQDATLPPSALEELGLEEL